MTSRYVDTDKNLRDIGTFVEGSDLPYIRYGAKLTIDTDTAPQGHCPSGLRVNNGELHVDGRYVREVAYTSGSGTIPAVGDTVTWTGGTGVVGRIISGNNVAGTMQITRGSTDANPTGTLTSGGWSATVSSDKVGLLILAAFDNAWDVEAMGTMRMTGEWYELGTGDGTDSQTFTLPYSDGVCNAVWVEEDPTGAPGVLTIWHYFHLDATSTVFYGDWNDWGAGYEDGKVFAHTTWSGNTITFGTSTNGGVIPNGAKVYIPNIYLRTVATGATDTDVQSVTSTSLANPINSTGQNGAMIFDKVSIGSMLWYSNGSNGLSIKYCGVPISNYNNVATAQLGSVYMESCCFAGGATVTNSFYSTALQILDVVTGMEIKNCIFGGLRNGGYQSLEFNTCSDVTLSGTNKFWSGQQDENQLYALEFDLCSDVTMDRVITIQGGVLRVANTPNVVINEVIFGESPNRGTTEDDCDVLTLTGAATFKVRVNKMSLAEDGDHFVPPNGWFASISDCKDVIVKNVGAVNNKIDCSNRFGNNSPFIIGGIATDVRIQNVYLTNVGNTVPFNISTTARNIQLINIGTDYYSSFQLDANGMVAKGVHGGSSTPDTVGGVDGDYISAIDAIFIDHFTSDTTGALSLMFNTVGPVYDSYVTFINGAYVNGIGDLYLPNSDSEAIYEWPYDVLGHTAFTNDALLIAGTDEGKAIYEYDIDDGTGYSGTWTALSLSAGGNTALAADSPANMEQGGWKIKFRIRRGPTMDELDKINGFKVATSTTITDQLNNLYPEPGIQLTLTGLPNGTDVVVLADDTETVLMHNDASSGDVVFDYTTQQTVDIKFYKEGYKPAAVLNYPLASTNASLPITLELDRNQ